MGVRGALVNWGFFSHASTNLVRAATSAASGAAAVASGAAASAAAAGAAAAGSPLRCLGPVAFFTVYGSVIALVKDVPDVRGDALFGIRSFSVRLGQKAVLRIAVGLLLCNYLAAASLLAYAALSGFGGAAAGASSTLVVTRRLAVSVAMALSGWSIFRKAREVVAPEDAEDVYGYYMHLWRCFYIAYAWLPFAR